MSRQLIEAGSINQIEGQVGYNDILEVSEFFYDTIQGEGINIGVPAAFLRLTNCTLNCTWCDSTEVWTQGSPYTIPHLLNMIYESPLLEKLENGQHLVITGGSPLKQQERLFYFLEEFEQRFSFRPYVEIENEAVLPVLGNLIDYVNCWNNSPKLHNSGNSRVARHKPKVLKQLSKLDNSWFKFVITCESNWTEIQEEYLSPGLINLDQIILMPEGQTRIELNENRIKTAKLAITHSVRFSDREHIILWNRKTGV